MIYVVTGRGNSKEYYYHCFSVGTLVRPLRDQEGVSKDYVAVEPLYPIRGGRRIQTVHTDDLGCGKRYESPLWRVLEGKG